MRHQPLRTQPGRSEPNMLSSLISQSSQCTQSNPVVQPMSLSYTTHPSLTLDKMSLIPFISNRSLPCSITIKVSLSLSFRSCYHEWFKISFKLCLFYLVAHSIEPIVLYGTCTLVPSRIHCCRGGDMWSKRSLFYLVWMFLKVDWVTLLTCVEWYKHRWVVWFDLYFTACVKIWS